jgi:hypothetical protein
VRAAVEGCPVNAISLDDDTDDGPQELD